MAGALLGQRQRYQPAIVVVTAKIVMIGTSPRTRGGVSAVVAVYAAAGLFASSAVRYLSTHCDGGVPAKLAMALSAWVRYAALLMRGKVQLLHVHSASGPSFWRKFMFIAPTLLARRPVVLHWHGGGLVGFYERSATWQRRLIGWVFTRCSRVIALSDQWHHTLSVLFPDARVMTIPNPVMVPAESAVLADVPRRIVFLGRINADKGLEDLLRAMPAVLASVPDGELVIAGAGEVERFRALAAQLGVGRAVLFPGWVDGDGKAGLLTSAAVFVLPSHLEAMPMSVLEAMAWGLPVVATRVGGIPQAVRDGTDGILLQPQDTPALANALIRILADVQFRRMLGVSARQRVQANFSAELIVPRVQALWESVLREREQRL